MAGKLPVVSGEEAARALVRAGFTRLARRGKGAHIFLYRTEPPKGLTVPNHDEVRRGTLREIIRQAGLSVDEFVGLL